MGAPVVLIDAAMVRGKVVMGLVKNGFLCGQVRRILYFALCLSKRRPLDDLALIISEVRTCPPSQWDKAKLATPNRCSHLANVGG